MAARKGLNCTLSYKNGKTTHTYRMRAGNISYGVHLVHAEDAGRIYRSFYPHKTANQQFSVQFLLKNWAERTDFTDWLTTYALWALDPNISRTVFPHLKVDIPSRNFARHGLPLTGYEWGAHTGMMLFTPTFVFEASLSPGQASSQVTVSSVTNKWSAFASGPAIRYFYPFGTQLQASQVPTDYGKVTAGSSDTLTPLQEQQILDGFL